MLTIQRVSFRTRSILPTPLSLHGYSRRDYGRQSPSRHDDSDTKAGSGNIALPAPTPLRPVRADSLADEAAHFPADVSEFIKHHEPTHAELISNAEEVELDRVQKLDSTIGYNNGNVKDDRETPSFPVQKSPHQLLERFLPTHTGRKVDLSSIKATWLEDKVVEPVEPATATFRNTDGLRKILSDYILNVEPHAEHHDGEEAYLIALWQTFSGESLSFLQGVGYDVTDVASWSWIFTSKSVDHAFARYAMLARDMRQPSRGRIPKFVPLQLLRSGEVSAYALKQAIQSILLDLQLCLDDRAYSGWNWVTRVCMVVRLIRHARRVAPECFEDITTVVKHLFSDYYTVHSRQLEELELRRMSLIFNRFLSLLSLAPRKTPFNSYLLQQDAQLVLLRLMFSFEPQIPLNREGYRALIAVQLLHPKTTHERTWAEAKSLSWPPWRKMKLGIEQDLEFPGRDSRVIKLLRRMQEAGYTLGDWDKSAGILAGWDTDQSPTIQTRGILMRQRKPWLLSWRPWLSQSDAPEGQEQFSADGPTVWAARIRATRTIREAWASFRAYEKSSKSSIAHHEPYFVMMDRLLAPIVKAGSNLEWNYLAGDIKETFETSENPREVIYVDVDVPTVDEFYQRMLQAGIKPGGSLMASLLKHSLTTEAGFAYIRDSGWDEVTKDVLRNAHKYPVSVLRSSLDKIPKNTLTAFVSLLCRSGLNDSSLFSTIGRYHPATKQIHGDDGRNVSATTYASQLLLVTDVNDTQVWNGVLQGISMGLEKHLHRKGPALGASNWGRLRTIVNLKHPHMEIRPDLVTFRHQARILHLTLSFAGTGYSFNFASRAKTTFIGAVYGLDLKTFLPGKEKSLVVVPMLEDLRLLVGVLASIHDSQGLAALVKWINEHAGTLGSMERKQGSDLTKMHPVAGCDSDQRAPSQLRDVLCAVRLFLDGHIEWPAGQLGRGEEVTGFSSPLPADVAALQQAQDQSQMVDWPSDEEVVAFHGENHAWMERITRAADMMARRKAGRGKEAREEI